MTDNRYITAPPITLAPGTTFDPPEPPPIPKTVGSIVQKQERLFQYHPSTQKTEVWMGHDLGWCEVLIKKDAIQ